MCSRCIVRFSETSAEEKDTLGRTLYNQRVRTDQSLREVCTALGKPPRWLGDVEHDRVMPTAQEVRDLAVLIRLEEATVTLLCKGIEDMKV